MSAVDETESLAAAARRFDRDALERIDPKTEAALARMESRLGFVERFGLVHDPLVVHQLAWAAQCRGDLEGAIVRLREAVHRDPAAPINHSELGHLLTLRGDFGAAVDRFLSAQARSEPDGPLAAALAEGLRRTIRLGLQTSGLGLAEVVLDRTPADGEALHLAGEILAATGQGDRVLAALTPDRLPEALRADPPVGLLLLRGKLLAQRRRHAEARECFGAAHERQPERFEVHLSLAEQLYLEGQRGKARAEVEELRSAHPNRPEPLLFLAQLEREAGRPAQARQLQREAAELRQHGTSR